MMILLIIITIFVVFSRFGLTFAKPGGNLSTAGNYYIYTAYPVLYRPGLKLSYTWYGGRCEWFLKGRAIPSAYFRVRHVRGRFDGDPRNRSELSLDGADEADPFVNAPNKATVRIYVMNCTVDGWRKMQLSTGKYLIRYPVILNSTLRDADVLLGSSRSLGRFRPLKISCMTGEVAFTKNVLDNYMEGSHDEEPYSCLWKKANFLEWNEVLILAGSKDKAVRCEFAGKPTPVVEFHRNGVRLNTSNSGVLRWSDNDSAWWRCIARNTHGSLEMYQLRLIHPGMSNVSVRNVSNVEVSFPTRLHQRNVSNAFSRRVVVWLQQDATGRLLLRQIGAVPELDTSRWLRAYDLDNADRRRHQFWCIACVLRAPTGKCFIQRFRVHIDPNYAAEDDAGYPPAHSTGKQRLTTSQSAVPLVFGEVKAVAYNPLPYYLIFILLMPIFGVFLYVTFVCVHRYRWCLQSSHGQVLLFNRNITSNSSNVAFKPPTPQRSHIVPIRSVADLVPIRSAANLVPIRSVTRHQPSRRTPPPLTPPLSCSVVSQPGIEEHHSMPDLSRSSQPTQRLTYVTVAPQEQEDPYEEENWEIDFNRLLFIRQLGVGNFGRVFLANLDAGSSYERKVAVKTARDCDMLSVCSGDEISFRSVDSSVSPMMKEVELMKSLGHHENVTDFIGYSLDASGQPYLLMEYCSRGNLGDYLRHRAKHYGSFPIHKKASEVLVLQNFACQVARGMQFLSEKKFIHRDLATRNVLVNETFVCKVSDFGLSRKLPGNEPYYIQKAGKFPWKWMAPEILLRSRPLYSTKSDVWSFGILLWEVFTYGNEPYPELTHLQLIDFLKAGLRMPFPSFCSAKIKRIMAKCWEDDSRLRPSFGDIVNCLSVIETERE